MSRRQWAAMLAWSGAALAATPWWGALATAAAFIDPAAALLPLAPALALAALALEGRHIGAVGPGLAALALSAVSLVRETPLTQAAAGPRLVVVSQNMWVGNVDPAAAIAALADSGADVLFLQEVDGTVAPFLDQLRARYPFGSHCRPRCSMAIFSRWPAERVRYRFRDDRGRRFGPGLVHTRIHVPGVPIPVPVVSIHLSRRGDARERLAEAERLAAALADRPSPATLVAGDFNLSGWSPGMRRLESGLAPLARATRGQFTYPGRVAGLAWPMPLVGIDHVFAGPGWTVARTAVLEAAGSDHRPIRVELVWQD